jgi:two-component system, NtrC family, response regulator HydG
LSRRLASSNWHVVQVRSLSLAARRLREEDFLVGLVTIDRAEHSLLQEFEACRGARACEWVAIMPPGDTASSQYQELVLNHLVLRVDEPVVYDYLLYILEHAWERAQLERASMRAASEEGALGMIGRSPAVVALRKTILKTGPTEAAVLIGGESGSGKELVAHALHSVSRRAAGPFVIVNCASLPPTLIVSELFGHERGSFTGAVAQHRGLLEAATKGTLFLDEVAELPLEVQATILRYLQEKTIQRIGSTQSMAADGRVIAASHVDVAQAVAAGRFREDLYFRLNVLSIFVPPLRERREDIPLLAQHFFEVNVRKRPSKAIGFSARAMAAMMAYEWPGNVRELAHRVQRAVIMAEHRLLSATELGFTNDATQSVEPLQEIRIRAERSAITVSLDRAHHNVTVAAKDLGVSRMTLYRLMAKHHISAAEGSNGGPATNDAGNASST